MTNGQSKETVNKR